MDRGITIGLDMGDEKHEVCVLDERGEIVERGKIRNAGEGVCKLCDRWPGATVVMEAGTHSPWVSRLVESKGLRAVVANPRKVRAIWDREDKGDAKDAEMLARLGRMDVKLLQPIRHRGAEAQRELMRLKARDGLVGARTDLINMTRGLVKSWGARLPKCSAESFGRKAAESVPEELREMLHPVVEMIEELSQKIAGYDRQVERVCQKEYPETERLRQVSGVGALTALAYVLTLEDADRHRRSRSIGPFLGLVPKRDQSGKTDKQLRITKAGNAYLRRLLVGSGQYILGPFGPDCELRRFGQRLAQRGGKNAKRRAVVAVARKLAVLLHRLWRTGEVYQPLRSKEKMAA